MNEPGKDVRKSLMSKNKVLINLKLCFQLNLQSDWKITTEIALFTS